MKNIKKLVPFLCLVIGLVVPAYAMHIMEGFLPPVHAIIWAVLCLPVLIIGIKKLTKVKDYQKTVIMVLAMSGAYAFVLSALKFPSVTGSSSHPTGMGLVAVLFGPWISSVVGFVVLLFQAILLAHGGLTTLGANTFSMGIVGPFVSFGIYKLSRNMNLSKKWSVFLAAALGDLLTYVVTSFQLAFAHPAAVGGFSASLVKFMGIFAATQVPICIIEGILTVLVFNLLESLASSELKLLEA